MKAQVTFLDKTTDIVTAKQLQYLCKTKLILTYKYLTEEVK